MAPDPAPYKPAKQHVVASGVHTVRLQPEPRRVRMTFIGDNYTASRLIDLMIDDCLSLCTLDVQECEQPHDWTLSRMTLAFVCGCIVWECVRQAVIWL